MELESIRRRFRRLIVFSLAASLIPGALALAADSASELEPQAASVQVPGATVRSGPSENYYLTDTLPADAKVEVYRLQSDGWCAIRPPADSFSWVFAEHLRVVSDGIAEVAKEDVAGRVGSRLGSQRDVVQVRLHKGETVSILGRDERDGGLWYKIAPPAGEFRWMRAEDIGLSGVRSDQAVKLTSGNIEPPPLAAREASSASPPPPSSGQWTPAHTPMNGETGKALPSPPITPLGPRASASTELAGKLSELEVRLSRMVSDPPATWNIAPLEQAAEQLLSHADTVADRDAVKATLGKIDRFAAIQRRYAGNMAGTTLGAALQPNAATPATGATSPYDAVGILRPVVSRRPGAPQFALVNEQGQVITFVTGTPDTNLQPFIGQRVGISGSRGYIPEFRRAHLTAGRVTPMNDRLLR